MGLPLKLPKGIRARPWVRRQLGTGRKSGCGASWRQKFDGNSKGPGSRFAKVGERIHQVNFRSERSEDSVRRRVLSFGMSVWITFFGSALGSYLLGFPVAALLLRCGVIDRPNARSSHARPTIRGGGIAILAALGLAGIKLVLDQGGGVSTVLLLGALVLAVVSFLDEASSLKLATSGRVDVMGLELWLTLAFRRSRRGVRHRAKRIAWILFNKTPNQACSSTSDLLSAIPDRQI